MSVSKSKEIRKYDPRADERKQFKEAVARIEAAKEPACADTPKTAIEMFRTSNDGEHLIRLVDEQDDPGARIYTIEGSKSGRTSRRVEIGILGCELASLARFWEMEKKRVARKHREH